MFNILKRKWKEFCERRVNKWISKRSYDFTKKDGYYYFVSNKNDHTLYRIKQNSFLKFKHLVSSDKLYFIEGIYYGWIFYFNFDNTLCKVRIDGTERTTFHGIDVYWNVFDVKNDFIILQAPDGYLFKIESYTHTIEKLRNTKVLIDYRTG